MVIVLGIQKKSQKGFNLSSFWVGGFLGWFPKTFLSDISVQLLALDGVVGCVTVAHRTSGHRVFVTSAHRYCDNWSLPSGHLVIEILDIWSSKSGHLVIAFLKFAPQL